METQSLVRSWFEKWTNGEFTSLPLADEFRHTSPYGTIQGKAAYLQLVESNRDKFLGNRFEVKDELFGSGQACVRYTMHAPEFTMEVSEWFFIGEGLIQEIVSYYNIPGEIREDRKLSDSDNLSQQS